MNAWDLVLIGGFLLPGILLLAHGVGKVIDSTDGPLRERIARFHGAWRDRLFETGIFPFPGVRLVTSCRPLVAGEAVFAGVLVLGLASSSPSTLRTLSSALLGLAAGFLVLFLSFRDQARRQILALRASLPVASFLLSLLLEAGIGSHVALQEVSGALPPGPLAEELGEISRSRSLGLPRKETLDRSRRRVPLDDYHTLLNLIQQGEELGVGLSRALREHSGTLLEKQRQRAEAFAQKAAIRILLPLVLFIFPAVFLVILSPVLLNLWEMWRR